MDFVGGPIVHVSTDGSMGWAAGKGRLSGKYVDESGMEQTFTVVIAWLGAYEKSDGEWVEVAVAETSPPDEAASEEEE